MKQWEKCCFTYRELWNPGQGRQAAKLLYAVWFLYAAPKISTRVEKKSQSKWNKRKMFDFCRWAQRDVVLISWKICCNSWSAHFHINCFGSRQCIKYFEIFVFCSFLWETNSLSLNGKGKILQEMKEEKNLPIIVWVLVGLIWRFSHKILSILCNCKLNNFNLCKFIERKFQSYAIAKHP